MNTLRINISFFVKHYIGLTHFTGNKLKIIMFQIFIFYNLTFFFKSIIGNKCLRYTRTDYYEILYSSGDSDGSLDVTCQQLVLDVPDNSGRVILSKKQFGARSQLWRMTGEGQLQHEGSSPPRASADKILVCSSFRVCG